MTSKAKTSKADTAKPKKDGLQTSETGGGGSPEKEPGKRAAKPAPSPADDTPRDDPPNTTGGGTGTPLLKRVAPSSGSHGASKG